MGIEGFLVQVTLPRVVVLTPLKRPLAPRAVLRVLRGPGLMASGPRAVPAGVLALQRSHPGRGLGAPLRRPPVLWASHRGRLLLRHVPRRQVTLRMLTSERTFLARFVVVTTSLLPACVM